MPLFNDIFRHQLARPFGIWGKLPDHGDYLRHRCSVAQAHDWQLWVSQYWGAHQAELSRSRVNPENQYIQSAPTGHQEQQDSRHSRDLDSPDTVNHLLQVPVAFVMHPGVLGFSGNHFVQGVIVSSHDRVGRACPIIIFQQASPYWMRQIWAPPPSQKNSGPPTSAPRHTDTIRNQLYWLARLAARLHRAQRGWDKLVQSVDAIDKVYAPGWANFFGAHPKQPDTVETESLLAQYCGDAGSDTAFGLHGVQRLPWADWPTRILRSSQRTQAYWQQDMHGGYVNAGENPLTFWKLHP